MTIDFTYYLIILYSYMLGIRTEGKINLNIEELFKSEFSTIDKIINDSNFFSRRIKYDIDIDYTKVRELSKKYDKPEYCFEYMYILYNKIIQSQDSNQVALKSFRDDYAGDMLKIRELLNQTKGKSPLFIRINSSSDYIDNKNGWFSNLLNSFIDDYLHPDVDFKLATKKIGRPYVDVNRKYFQFIFFVILTSNRSDKKILSDTLRCLKEFMELLGFTFNLGFRTESEYIKVMRTEIREIERNGFSYNPIQVPKYSTEINYIKRVEALESGKTYMTFDERESFKREPKVIEDDILNDLIDHIIKNNTIKDKNYLNSLSDLLYRLIKR